MFGEEGNVEDEVEGYGLVKFTSSSPHVRIWQEG